MDHVSYSPRDLFAIATLTASLHVDGHRADLVILKSARAHAAYEGRTSLNDRDIALAAELALPHRLRRGPFQSAEVELEDLQSRIQQIQSQDEPAPGAASEAADEGETGDKKKAARSAA